MMPEPRAETSLELWEGVRLLDPIAGTDTTAHVLIEAGQIQAVNPPSVSADVQRRDGQQVVIGPALVDLYGVCGEPGAESRDTLASLAAAGAAGGFGSVALLPQAQPAIDQPALLAWRRDRYDRLPEPKPTLHQWAAITKGAAGQALADLAELAAAGAVGWADGQPLTSPTLLRHLLDYAGPLARPLMLFGRDRSLAGSAAVVEGSEALRLGLVGAPVTAETSAIASLLAAIAANETPPAIHLMRLSTARGVDLVRQAQAAGLAVTASTTWLHLICDTTQISGQIALPGSDRPALPYDPGLRLEPPLGNPADRAALIAGVADGTISAIASDRSPQTYEEATVAFAESPPGAIGLELVLPLLWSSLVATGELSALQLWSALSIGPARCLGIDPAPRLAALDLADRWVARPPNLHSIATNTPWFGHVIPGRARLLA